MSVNREPRRFAKVILSLLKPQDSSKKLIRRGRCGELVFVCSTVGLRYQVEQFYNDRYVLRYVITICRTIIVFPYGGLN